MSAEQNVSSSPCSRCGGYGEDMNWLEGTPVVCSRCGGSGIERQTCASCGSALTEAERTWTASDGRVWHWSCMERVFTPRPEDRGMTLQKAAGDLW